MLGYAPGARVAIRDEEWLVRRVDASSDGIPLVRLDSVGLQRVRNSIPSNHNPFNYYDRTVISVDTLKSNLEYRNYVENPWWDINECQNVAARANEEGLARRARLARQLRPTTGGLHELLRS